MDRRVKDLKIGDINSTFLLIEFSSIRNLMHNIITKRNYMPNVYFKAKLMLATKDDWLVQQKLVPKIKYLISSKDEFRASS